MVDNSKYYYFLNITKMFEGIRDKFKAIPRENIEERKLDETRILELRKEVKRLDDLIQLKIGDPQEQGKNQDRLFTVKNELVDLEHRLENLKERGYY